MYYARLRDLVLYMYKNAIVANAAARAEELHNLHQQQTQQHQNYMRHLAMQQQQQQLAALQSRDQPQHTDDHSNNNEDAKVNEHSGISSSDGHERGLIYSKSTQLGDSSVKNGALELDQLDESKPLQSSSMQTIEVAEAHDNHTSESDELDAE